MAGIASGKKRLAHSFIGPSGCCSGCCRQDAENYPVFEEPSDCQKPSRKKDPTMASLALQLTPSHPASPFPSSVCCSRQGQQISQRAIILQLGAS